MWGGGDGRSDDGANDGAVLDPVTGRWSLLPDAPASGRSLHSMVDTGNGVYVSATRTQLPPLVLHLPSGPSLSALRVGVGSGV